MVRPSKFAMLLILFVFSTVAFAANWYVDPGATGSQNGTSWANAWKTPSSINWGLIAPGDTVFISGGAVTQSYGTGFTVGSSGSSNANRITVRIGQDPGHSGIAIFNGPIAVNNRNFVTVDGSFNGIRSFEVVNTEIQIQNTTNVTIRYMDIHGSGATISGQYSGAGDRIEYNYLHDISADAAISMANPSHPTGYDRQFISNNTIQLNRDSAGSGGGSDGIQGSWGLTIEYNTFLNAIGPINPTQHQDFIQMQANYVTIRGNTFLHSADSCIDYDTFNGQPDNHRIYNNTFVLNRGSGIRYYNSGGSPFNSISNILIANNTFVNHISGHQWALSFQFFSGAINPVVTNSTIQNNTFYDDINPVHIEASSNATQASWNFDYNLINAGPSGTTNVTLNGSSYTQAHPRTGAPTFAKWVENPTNFGNNNFTMPDLHLAAVDTAAKDLGVTRPEFSVDQGGTARPQGPGWDIGAWEVTASSVSGSPGAPVITSVVVH